MMERAMDNDMEGSSIQRERSVDGWMSRGMGRDASFILLSSPMVFSMCMMMTRHGGVYS
jgi:hypothetical protein